MSGARQQRAAHKQRKAKARAKQEQEFRSWIDRDRCSHARRVRPAPNPFAAAELMMRLAALPGADERERQREDAERFLCRVFGEDYRP